MTKSTTGARTAGPSKQYLKKGGKYQSGGVKLGQEAKAKMKAMTEPTSNPALRKFKKPMKQSGGAAKDTTGMTFPYVSPKGAIYSTGKDYMSGTPSSPVDPRNRDYMSKQDSTTQGKTGYTALTKGEKKKGGMVKKQMGGVAAVGKLVGGDPNAKAYRKEKREQKRFDKKMKKQDGGGIDFKKTSDMLKKKSNSGGYNSESIKKTLPGVKSGPKKMTPPSPRERKPNEIPYKKKGGMTKSKK